MYFFKSHLICLWNIKHVFFFVIFTCLLTVTLDEIWAAFRNLIATAHAVHVVAMEITTLKGCREAFVSLNGCREWQNTRGRLAWRMFDQVLIYSARLLLRRIFLMETNCSEQGCCVFLPKSLSLSRTLPGLSWPPSAAILDKFMKKQMAATGFLPTVFSLYTAFGWNLGPCLPVKPRPFVYACQ